VAQWSWQEFQDLEEFQAVQVGEVKPSAGEEGQGPGWQLAEAGGSFPWLGPIWSPHLPPVEGVVACIGEEGGCSPADSLS